MWWTRVRKRDSHSLMNVQSPRINVRLSPSIHAQVLPFRLHPRKPRHPGGQEKDAIPVCAAFREVMRYARASSRAARLSAVSSARAHQQRCAVRLSYARAGTPGLWKAHGRYLARDSALEPIGRSKEAGFDQTEEGVDLSARLNHWQSEGDPRLWKVILSPEFGERLDLVAFTRRWVEQVERETGHPLEWAAVVHTNTDHPHVHVAIRGVDRSGAEVKFQRDYVRSGMREAAQNLCARILGRRTAEDAELAQQRETVQPHMTSLDRLIGKAALEENGDAERFIFALERPGGPQGGLALRLALRLNTLTPWALLSRSAAVTGPFAATSRPYSGR